MKKLMLASVLALGAMATLAIESSNTVGYNETTYRKGYTLVVPEFDKVGVEGMDIQSIMPDSETIESYGAGDISVQTFTDGAGKDEMFWYFSADESYDEETPGWYSDISGKNLASKTFNKGEGFMLYMPVQGTLNVSGEVSLSEKEVEFRKGYTLTGNFRPIKVNIQDLIVPEDSLVSDYGAGDISIQTFTDGAGKDEMFWYFSADEAYDEETPGWYSDISGKNFANKTFTLGEGFMLYMPAKGKITFKAVSIEK